ncbi:MAG: hypothetical protein JST87_07825 [Bacteroidetes bacterium]|nr:hypothetical protein [Bacteroidota bacterium]MBS1933485.1 hypothetical protein [Bacteroidota bacterium]
MKQSILAFILFVAIAANAQSDKYAAAMQKNLVLLDSAKTTLDLENASNAFIRVGDAEKTQWLPYYYAALAQTRIGWMDKKVDADKLAEKTKAIVAKAEAIENNAELCTIDNMIATQQMLVDPQTRWQTYGVQASAALKKAKELDPNNPRIYYLEAMNVFGTPEQFGGGKAKAKPIFQKAVDLYKTFEVKPLYPDWGKKEAEDMLAKCE